MQLSERRCNKTASIFRSSFLNGGERISLGALVESRIKLSPPIHVLICFVRFVLPARNNENRNLPHILMNFTVNKLLIKQKFFKKPP